MATSNSSNRVISPRNHSVKHALVLPLPLELSQPGRDRFVAQARAGVQVLQHGQANAEGIRDDEHAAQGISDRSAEGRCASPIELHGPNFGRCCLSWALYSGVFVTSPVFATKLPNELKTYIIKVASETSKEV